MTVAFPAMPVHADADQLDSMAAGDLDEPVVMLNLLKYADETQAGHGVDHMTGREGYALYGKAFAALHDRFGGEPIWMGRVGNTIIGADAEDWDICILVQYPTRRQFVEMIRDADYQAIAPIRSASLIDSRLIEMSQLLPRQT
jgi:uncharacterized protein (DUF1330 family)